MGREGIREQDPHAVDFCGLHSQRTAISDYSTVARECAKDIVVTGGKLLLGFPVISIFPTLNGVSLKVGEEELVLNRVIICAGLQSDHVTELAGDEEDPEIVPFRGEYYRLLTERKSLVKRLIHPVPDPKYPF